MISQYPHLIDLNDYPVSWWNKIIELGHDIKITPRDILTHVTEK